MVVCFCCCCFVVVIVLRGGFVCLFLELLFVVCFTMCTEYFTTRWQLCTPAEFFTISY